MAPVGTLKLSCEITGVRKTISGMEHVIVRKPSGFEFFLDNSFLFVLQNIGEEGLQERAAEKLGLDSKTVERIMDILVKSGFVRESE